MRIVGRPDFLLPMASERIFWAGRQVCCYDSADSYGGKLCSTRQKKFL
ncbi:MAG: hypothetical protein JXN61_15245 [Sedimentisphaerales bacterium]|nr:hypothetical protein [Sedimentisphaerales bacterium]